MFCLTNKKNFLLTVQKFCSVDILGRSLFFILQNVIFLCNDGACFCLLLFFQLKLIKIHLHEHWILVKKIDSCKYVFKIYFHKIFMTRLSENWLLNYSSTSNNIKYRDSVENRWKMMKNYCIIIFLELCWLKK